MLDLELVNQTIQEIENDETTVFNCQVLAALYKIQERHASDMRHSNDSVVTELKDLFPEYKKYKEVKLRYQQNQESKTVLAEAIKELCTEIQQFIQTLYSATEIPEEREQIRNMILILKGLF